MWRQIKWSMIFAVSLVCGLSGLSGGEVRPLFNGRDLTGWSTYTAPQGKNSDKNGVFTVQDGTIRISGEENGSMATEESFSDYRLTLEFKWGEATWGKRKGMGRDSGILIHSIGPEGARGTWMQSFEANLMEGGIGDFWLIAYDSDNESAVGTVVTRPDGRIFDPKNGKPFKITSGAELGAGWFGRDPAWRDEYGFRGANDLDRPNDWNKITVEARGSEMIIYVNDVLVNRVYDLSRTEGKIQLQSEGSEIFFRNITLEKF